MDPRPWGPLPPVSDFGEVDANGTTLLETFQARPWQDEGSGSRTLEDSSDSIRQHHSSRGRFVGFTLCPRVLFFPAYLPCAIDTLCFHPEPPAQLRYAHGLPVPPACRVFVASRSLARVCPRRRCFAATTPSAPWWWCGRRDWPPQPSAEGQAPPGGSQALFLSRATLRQRQVG